MKIKIIVAFVLLAINGTTIMAQEKIKQTAGRDQLGEFAPKFAELNDDVLFGEVWSRTDKLGLRDRSLVTITSLISQGITDSSLIYIFSRLSRMVSPALKSPRFLPILVSMPDGLKHGLPSVWLRMCGQKIQQLQMPGQLSSVK